MNGYPKGVLQFTADEFKKIDLKLALQYALDMPEVKEFIGDRKIERSNYVYYPYCHGILSLFPQSSENVKDAVQQ